MNKKKQKIGNVSEHSLKLKFNGNKNLNNVIKYKNIKLKLLLLSGWTSLYLLWLSFCV